MSRCAKRYIQGLKKSYKVKVCCICFKRFSSHGYSDILLDFLILLSMHAWSTAGLLFPPAFQSATLLVIEIKDIYFFEVNTKYISSNALKISVISRVRSTSEIAVIFST